MQLQRITPLDDTLYDYLLRLSVTESDELIALRDYTYTHVKDAKMQIAPDQGQFMAMLIKLIGAKHILEVGTFTGYSTLVMAQALPDHGRIITCDKKPETSNIAQRFWKEAKQDHKITLKLGRAEDTLQSLIDQPALHGSFDFIFLDVNKSSHWFYYECGLKLLRPGGLIAIDNVFWHGNVADPECTITITRHVREFNQKIHTDDRVEICMLAIGDGLTLARKKGLNTFR